MEQSPYDEKPKHDEKEKRSSGTNIVLIILAVIGVVAIVCFALLVVLVLLGPSIGNVFSNIIEGLDAAP